MLLSGLRRLLRLLRIFIRSRIRFLLYFFRICKRPRRVDYKDCLRIPDERNLRPDPYIYSQDWLKLRGISYTWDNPDIEVIDTTNGDSVGRHDLLQGRPYEIRATISNHSATVPALDTLVLFKVKSFGAGSATLASLPPDTVDVPNGGSNVATSHWTPEETGHFCIKVIIVHSNDANALNNVGQHNTDVSKPGDADEKQMVVRNDRKHRMEIEMKANTYALPESPMRPKSPEERNSARYLQALQAANAPDGFPVPEGAELTITPRTFALGPGEEVKVSVALGSGFEGRVNVDAISKTNVLLGGITIIREA